MVQSQGEHAKSVKVALFVASILVWSILFNLQFAFIVTAILVIHEYGHYFMAKRFGMRVGGIFMIPLFGAVTTVDLDGAGPRAKAITSLGGALAGATMALICMVLALVLHSQLLAGIAGLTALLNLFNLAPFLSLDGKKVVNILTPALGPKVKTASLAVTLFLSFVSYEQTFFFVFFLLANISLIQLVMPRYFPSEEGKDKVVVREKTSLGVKEARGIVRFYSLIAFTLTGILWFVIIDNHGFQNLWHVVGG